MDIVECPRCGNVIVVNRCKKLIVEVLKDNKELRWLEILDKTRLSKGALSKHLNDLIKNGLVDIATVPTRPPSTKYFLGSKLDDEKEEER